MRELDVINDDSDTYQPVPDLDIEESGWHVVLVSGDERKPATAYSVGLFKSFGHPEIVIFGDKPAVLRRVIDRFGEQVRQGRCFVDGESVSGIVEHYDVRLDEIPRRFYADDAVQGGADVLRTRRVPAHAGFLGRY